MNYHEIRIGDKVQMIGQPATKGTVEKKVYTKTVVENGSHETTFEVSVKYDNARNVTYKVDPNKLEPALVEPDYSPFNLHNESPTDFELRQNEIRKNYHKVRAGESWAEYENRTGLVNPIGQVYGCNDEVRNKPVSYTDSQLSTMNQIALAANRTLTVFVDYDERGIYEKSKKYSNLQFLVWIK